MGEAAHRLNEPLSTRAICSRTLPWPISTSAAHPYTPPAGANITENPCHPGGIFHLLLPPRDALRHTTPNANDRSRTFVLRHRASARWLRPPNSRSCLARLRARRPRPPPRPAAAGTTTTRSSAAPPRSTVRSLFPNAHGPRTDRRAHIPLLHAPGPPVSSPPLPSSSPLAIPKWPSRAAPGSPPPSPPN